MAVRRSTSRRSIAGIGLPVHVHGFWPVGERRRAVQVQQLGGFFLVFGFSLARAFPLHVVTEWLGNTPQVALQHYLRVTDEDFERAARPATPDSAKSSAHVAQNAAQQAHAPNRTESQETTKAPDGQGLMRNRVTPGDVVPEAQVAGTGFEREPFLPGNSQIATTGAAKSGAPDAANHKVEAELLEVIDAWPLLSADLREAVLTIVRAGRNG